MEIVNSTDVFNGRALEPDIEWLQLDGEELATSALRLLRAVAREGLMYGELNRNGAVTELAQNARQFLTTRDRFLRTDAAKILTPTVSPTHLANAASEPMSVETALDIVDVIL